MALDIITAVVVVTAVFFPSLGLAFLFAAKTSAGGTNADSLFLANRILATLVVVYFLSLTELLLIAQQISLALGTFAVGFVAVAFLNAEPGLRGKKHSAVDANENWRK